MTTTTAPTPVQLNYLYKLAGDRVAPSLSNCGEERIEHLGALVENGATRRQVSTWIDYLKRQPRDTASADAEQPTRPARPAELTPGVYEIDGAVYVVKLNREKTRTYAKRLVESADRLTEADEVVRFDYEYERGAIFKIQPEHRVSLERAEALAIRYGQCLDCGRKLKAARSVAVGIGPICRRGYR